jgi:uncharacterized protein involved in cysteine biosynthesis
MFSLFIPQQSSALVLILFIASSLAVLGRYFYAYGEDKSGFPDGFDAVQAAPNSHKVTAALFLRALRAIVKLSVLNFRLPTLVQSPRRLVCGVSLTRTVLSNSGVTSRLVRGPNLASQG